MALSAAWLGACDSNDPPPVAVPPVLSGGPSCLDSDRDGFIHVSCGGLDCDDTDPYINPDVVDGVWSLETRFSSSAERVMWFSLDEAGNAHWITDITQQSSGDSSVGLYYAVADGVGFGAPMSLKDVLGPSTKLDVWLDDSGAHILDFYQTQRTLFFVSEAEQWQKQTVSNEATSVSQLVKLNGEWHTTFTIDYSQPLLRHARRLEGLGWETYELGEGSADGLFVRDGELQMLSTVAGSCFRQGRWTDELWSFTEYGEGDSCKVRAVTVDEANRLHVLFVRNADVWIATEEGGVWSETPVPTELWVLTQDEVQISTSFFVDAAGAFHIAVTQHPDDVPLDAVTWPLWYIGNAGVGWQEEVVARQAGAVMVAGPDGAPIIAMSRYREEPLTSANFGSLLAPQLVLARRSGADGIDQNCDGADGG